MNYTPTMMGQSALNINGIGAYTGRQMGRRTVNLNGLGGTRPKLPVTAYIAGAGVAASFAGMQFDEDNLPRYFAVLGVSALLGIGSMGWWVVQDDVG